MSEPPKDSELLPAESIALAVGLALLAYGATYPLRHAADALAPWLGQ